LVLEPRDAPLPQSAALAVIPFWFVRDHYLLARGSLNDKTDQLFLVDTGLAGFAFTGPQSTLRDADIALPPTPADTTSRAVGQSAAAPFAIRALSLGMLRRENLTGLYGPFPPSLESSLGVYVGGIVSHAFFRPYAVTFDFAQMKIYLRKPQA